MVVLRLAVDFIKDMIKGLLWITIGTVLVLVSVLIGLYGLFFRLSGLFLEKVHLRSFARIPNTLASPSFTYYEWITPWFEKRLGVKFTSHGVEEVSTEEEAEIDEGA